MKVKIFDESHEKDLEEAINNFTKRPDQIFIIDELEEQDDSSVRQLGEWMVR